MDKSWIFIKNRALPQYLNGVEQFLNFAFSNSNVGVRIQCPCIRCNNILWKTREEVKTDLLRRGIDSTYDRWIYHGESDSSSDDGTNVGTDSDIGNDDASTFEMLHDLYRGIPSHSHEFDKNSESSSEESNTEDKIFYRLLKDAEQKLYPDCEKFSKLSFVMRLFQMKCLHGWSNTSFDSLLKLLSDVLPKGNMLPNSIYEVQKIIKGLGLDYVKIDACVNNCILYRKEYADLEQCPKCGEKRWMVRKGEHTDEEVASENSNKRNKGISRKILRYFPIIPRLQRLFMIKRTAEDMRWHKNKKVDDGILRHPADSLAWKNFDEKYPSFASDPRNVRLGLASDGFNPFGSMSNAYRPGMDIDVYLQPLVDDLKTLWESGIETYDAFMKQIFFLRASLLWTINDFPAYGILSGWSTKGRKQCYMGHRRFLEINHPYRRNKSSFDNTKEERLAPQALSGDDVLAQLNTSSQMQHLEILRNENTRNVFKRHKEEFPLWFEKKVVQLKENGDGRITSGLLALARRPDPRAYCHNGYIMNGFRFRTMKSELGLKTQNSGVVVKSDEHTGNVDYYGKIRKILEIQYLDNNSVILFQCDWFEVPTQGRSQSRGYKRDEYGFICVNVTRVHYTNDPFILGSQAQSVYYVKHDQNENWHAVVRVRPQNLFDLPEQEDETESYQLIDLIERGEVDLQIESDNDVIKIQREDIDGVSVDAPSLSNEEEVDLEAFDESDHENGDDFNADEEYLSDEFDEIEDDDWL
ncbi:uncharacterized protein [Nicotiana sylvestris]|uniref:uncharacterized protein n=1 Tax=Nicotiana sylvestris TaxID=4096 RepID=UPI00388CD578